MTFRLSRIAEAIVGAMALLSTSVATAHTVPALVGGGASSVVFAMQLESVAFGNTVGQISYFSAGSGSGQTAFLSNNTALFGPGIAGPVDFANSDAALTATQIESYSRVLTDGPLIQIPYMTTPVAIPYVNGPLAATQATPLNTVALNDDDLCGIFSGKLVNWNEVTDPGTGSRFTLNAPITVVYDSDANGMGDLLTRHLAAQGICITGPAGNSDIVFTETMTFANLFPSGNVPANFAAASGESGIANKLVNYRTSGTAAIGYLSPPFMNSNLAPASPAAAANNLGTAKLVNRHNMTVYRPTSANAVIAVGDPWPPSLNRLSPNGSNPANPLDWVPNSADPTTGYPVSGTSQIIVSQCYANPAGLFSPDPAAALVSFLNDHYTNPEFGSILASNGFGMVPLGYVQSILADILSNSSGYGLDIGNSEACASFVGR